MAQKKEQQIQTITFEAYEFIPFACHYSDTSILTKTGELIEVVKVPNNGGLSDEAFREEIIKVLNKNIDPTKFAVWLHTVRSKHKKQNVSSETYTDYVDSLWKSCLPNSLKYKNTIYISLIRDNTKIKHWLPQNYLRSISHGLESRLRNKHLQQNNEDLDLMAETIVSDLAAFGAKRLEVYEKDGIYYSEAMEFINRTMSFSDERFYLPMCDLARKLVPNGLAFNNYIGSFSFIRDGKKMHGTVITIKETYKLSAMAVQDLLNADCELVVAQSLDFAYGNKLIPALNQQRFTLRLANDKEFSKIMDIADRPDQEFVLQQTGIIVVHDSVQALNNSVREIQTILNELGLVTFPEDIRIERAYWSSLPGNFSYLRRQDIVHKKEIAAFACFGIDKFTAVEDCFFGEPVTFFENHEGAPYALHFYTGGQSNVLIISREQEKRAFLANLLTSQSAKLGAKVIYYDKYGQSANFVQSVGGVYLDTLDIDKIKSSLTGEKTIIVINSIQQILENDGHEFFANFIDAVNDQNTIVIACVDYSDNCEALLPNFRTQLFTGGDIDSFANHFDIFDDEIDMITYLGEDNIYLKEGYSELVVKFLPPEKLVKTLLTGNTV